MRKNTGAGEKTNVGNLKRPSVRRWRAIDPARKKRPRRVETMKPKLSDVQRLGPFSRVEIVSNFVERTASVILHNDTGKACTVSFDNFKADTYADLSREAIDALNDLGLLVRGQVAVSLRDVNHDASAKVH